MGGTRVRTANRVAVVDGIVAAAVAALSLPATLGGDGAAGVLAAGTGVDGAEWLWFVAVHAPLAWRRRAPVVTAWAGFGLVAACVASGVTGVFVIFVPIVAVYTVARHRSFRALVAVVAAAVLMLGLAWLRDPGEWRAVMSVLSLVAAAASAGAALRTRSRLEAERNRHRRQRLEHDAKAAMATERARLAREVHDVVAHNLAVMVALADGASVTIGSRPDEAADMMDKAAATGREALAEMRRVVTLLRDGHSTGGDRPASVGGGAEPPQPLEARLLGLVERVRLTGLDAHLTRDGDRLEPAPEVGASAYRVVQESLTNVLKHAGPKARVSVLLRHEPTAFEVEVVDDGAAGDGPRRPVSAEEVADQVPERRPWLECDRGSGHGVTGLDE